MTNHIKPATSDEIQKIALEVKKMAAEVTKENKKFMLHLEERAKLYVLKKTKKQ